MSRLHRIIRLFIPRLPRAPALPISRITPSSSGILPPTHSRRRLFQTFSARLTANNNNNPTPDSQPSPNTLSGRLKILIKTYGWYALGVYLALDVLGFGVTFAAINFLGAEHVTQVTASIKGYVMGILGREVPPDDDESHPTGVDREGLYAMLALTYTVNKTLFLPVRVGLTAAITPKFVRWLGSRGWTGTEGAMRAATQIRARVRRSRVDKD